MAMNPQSLPSATSPAMLQEIYEQPASLATTLERYLPADRQAPAALRGVAEIFRRSDRLVIAASGSSRHAGLAGEIMMEDLAGIPVDVEYASEYIYRSTHSLRHPAVLVISQSGETADTLAALREANERDLPTLAITNNANSTMAREALVSLPTVAGKELAIPATKSFTTQLAVLYALALYLARVQGRMTRSVAEVHGGELRSIPGLLAEHLPRWRERSVAAAPGLLRAKNLIYLGRGVHFPIAREGALKMKESAYLSAESYPAGELKHGPNALVTGETQLVALATVDRRDPDSCVRFERMLLLCRELRQQGARLLAITTEGEAAMDEVSDECFFVPPVADLLAPLLEVVPLQLLALEAAVQQGIDVDRPRNLVKSVTDE